jgi:GAF domain-containing protein
MGAPEGRFGVGNTIVSEEKDKPVFDEQTLAKLLEAAYVLQEHSQELRALQTELGLPRKQKEEAEPKQPAVPEQLVQKPNQQAGNTAPPAKTAAGSASSKPDYTSILAQIAELQFQIEDRHLKPDQAMAMVAEHLIEICGAAGAGIGLTNGGKICYRAVAGIRALPLGSCVPLAKALCFPCLRTAQVFRCRDVNSQPPIDTHECRRRGIGSLIAVPIFQEKGTAGGLELYFSDIGAFSEEDVQTCQMMAGIITQTLERHGHPVASTNAANAVAAVAKVPNSQVPLPAVRCYKCGQELVGEEQFCGQCGAARNSTPELSGIQTKVASLWHKQLEDALANGAKPGQEARPALPSKDLDSSSLDSEVAINLRALQQSLENISAVADSSPISSEPSPAVLEQAQEDTTPETPSVPESITTVDWTSALSAREFLEQVAQGGRFRSVAKFWNEHRGDIYLAVSIIMVLCVIRWALWSHRPVAAKSAAPTTQATEHKPAAPQLSLFDRMLVSMGLAEAPEAPESKGNPLATVWVDLHTGLYYCPGADMYGKTPKGKFASQRDAQLDQFAPAYRKACD